MTLSSPTPPGFIIESQSMSVMFISAHQVGMGSHTAEYVIGWEKVMKIISEIFEQHIKMEKIIEAMEAQLKTWAKKGWIGRGKPVDLSLKISDESFFPPPAGQMKQIKIMFFDELITSITFFVRRKIVKESVSLKQLTLEKLSLTVPNSESVNMLELPRNLARDLKNEIDSCWQQRYLRDSKINSTKKSYTENFNDRRHAWRARTFERNHKFNINFR